MPGVSKKSEHLCVANIDYFKTLVNGIFMYFLPGNRKVISDFDVKILVGSKLQIQIRCLHLIFKFKYFDFKVFS